MTLAQATDMLIIYNNQLYRAAMQQGPDRERFMFVVGDNRGAFIRSLPWDAQRQLVEEGYLFEEETGNDH